MKKCLFGLSALAVLGGCLGLAWTSPAQDEKRAGADHEFVLKAARSGLAEVAQGKTAAETAAGPAVREFAQHMVKDHTQANEELRTLADRKQIALPKDLGKHQKATDRLATLRGAEFDREYMSHQVADHEEAVSLFEMEAKEGQDPDLKAWAGKTLPTLRDHLKMARAVAEKVGAGKADKDRSDK